MAKEKNNKKLKVAPWRIVKIFLISFLIFEIIFFLSFQGAKNNSLWPLDSSFYYYTTALLLASALFCYISLTQTFYEIQGPIFIHSKMGKITEYTFKNIVYLDEKFSLSKKMLRFFTYDGTEHLLVFDKKGVLFDTIREKSPLLTKEEFLRRFPNIKM